MSPNTEGDSRLPRCGHYSPTELVILQQQRRQNRRLVTRNLMPMDSGRQYRTDEEERKTKSEQKKRKETDKR